MRTDIVDARRASEVMKHQLASRPSMSISPRQLQHCGCNVSSYHLDGTKLFTHVNPTEMQMGHRKCFLTCACMSVLVQLFCSVVVTTPLKRALPSATDQDSA